MKILKRIGSILLDVLIVIVFIVSTLVVIATITAKRENGQANVLGYTINSVQTESMKGAINAGDLVVSKVVTDANKGEFQLKKGDVVSFYQELEEEKMILITHRIIDVEEISGTVVYTTQGDNREISVAPDAPMTINEIESVYIFRIPFLGRFIDFIKTPLGFILCLVIPLLSFIAFQAYKLITLYLKAKKLELVEEANNVRAENTSGAELSEEAKNAIIAEYLAKQALEKEQAEAMAADDAKKVAQPEEETQVDEETQVEEELQDEEETQVEEESDSEEKIEVEDDDKN